MRIGRLAVGEVEVLGADKRHDEVEPDEGQEEAQVSRAAQQQRSASCGISGAHVDVPLIKVHSKALRHLHTCLVLAEQAQVRGRPVIHVASSHGDVWIQVRLTRGVCGRGDRVELGHAAIHFEALEFVDHQARNQEAWPVCQLQCIQRLKE